MLLRSRFFVVLLLILCTEALSQGDLLLMAVPSTGYQTIEPWDFNVDWFHPDQDNCNLFANKVHSVTVAQASRQFTETLPEEAFCYDPHAVYNVGNTGYEPGTIKVKKNFQISDNYTLDFSTYIGGSGRDEMGDITTDNQGNIYITGWTGSSDFPTTPGTYNRTNNGGADAYVMKFDPTGNLIWSTYIGGPNTDLTYSIDIDSKGYIYVAGIGGKNFPTTSNAYQPNWNGTYFGHYGDANAVLVKMKPDDGHIVWSSYWGTAVQIRDLDIGPNDDVYVIHGYNPSLNQALFPSSWFTNAFQDMPQGNQDMVVARIASDGSQVLWATYLGGSGYDMADCSMAVDENGHVYIATKTESRDIPTPNGYDQTYNGAGDTYVAKLTPDGSSLVWGTYLGGSNSDGVLGKHGIAVDSQGIVYIASDTESADFPVTVGTYDGDYNGGTSGTWEQKGDLAVTKLTTDGQLMASTYIGGRHRDSAEGIALDGNGNVYFGIFTHSDNFPVTSSAFQSNYRGNRDAAFFRLSSDLSQLLYSSYMGTSSKDDFRAIGTDTDGNFYLAGITESSYWPTKNAYQSSYAGGRSDAIVAKFNFSDPTPVELAFFTATVSKNNVELIWQTTSESNNFGFEVERSQDRTHFTRIGFVAGQGTTAISHHYNFIDKNLHSGTYSYRLKQIDIDSRFEYSSIVEVMIDLPKKFILYQNYPNPFNSVTTIKYQLPLRSRVKLVILNLLGEAVTTLADTTQGPGVYQVQWDAIGLRSGLYWYKLEAGNFNQTRKILFLK